MSDIQSVQDLARALTSAKRDLEEAQTELIEAIHIAAEAERDYRRARSVAWTKSNAKTDKGRDAEVDLSVAEERYKAKLSEDLRVAALEYVRSCRAIMSAVQTLSNAWREEVAFARSGGPDGP